MSKELLFKALEREKTERVPWVPFVGCHGGLLLQKDAKTYLQSDDLIVQGIKKAIEMYKPDGVPVNFDLSLEAEALGCELSWSETNPPSVVNHVLCEKQIADLPAVNEDSGRFPVVLKTMKALKNSDMDVALYGLVTGPFTLALHLKGTDIFIDMYDHPEKVHELMEFGTQVGKKIADMYIKHGCDIISLVDPMTSQISPDAFRMYVMPFAKEIFGYIRRQNTYSSFFVCGDAQKNVEAMCETSPDNISVDENIPLDFVRKTCQKYHISFGGNLRLTTVLLMGSENDVRRHTIDTMDLAGDTGFILAPGCDLPYNTPPGNLRIVADIVRDPYQQDVARQLLKQAEEVRIDLSDYGRTDKVIVDIITLDSESCAPCQYMVESVRAITPHFKELVIWREHKIKERESVEFMMGLMVRNIPTICIDGRIKFVSRIPGRDELIHAIQERINEKFSMRLRERRGRLLLISAEDADGDMAWQNVEQAVRELGSTVEIQRINADHNLHKYGVASTPAVISIHEQVKSVGRVPSVEVIKEWLKNLQ